MKLDLDQLRELIRLLDEANLTEIEVEQDDDRIRVRRDPAPAVGVPSSESKAAHKAQSSGSAVAPSAPEEDDGAYITSPFVGTFYRAPSPDGEPFVDIGDSVVPGQVLCIVEAMKLMNEIEAEVAGTIVEVLVENGKPVEYGDRLFRIEIG
ncbi:MAG: acetyl-CoA carboxylase biotin carboxyl carrier protein [Deltaproteobacteria bacterium]|nr:acetyl-CoA carboxylase biotin carboxyl carrier protein [Deltaproteobacteria bacterium]NND29034.1 acetyl-CoA carboxylase biotin carboxyl carrier protein [Myxococcales bacterium]MBT8463959.1 acetyl-CoA carboxylase biotin carboxyl carrier protein [Deltaproteobacteria bacterium]MBT8480073.1 acetyl-CoA carboxylase biotin carboxyl carrier protein [Deltaproteobacteria bacterium]NNK07755.1 acetyl-CoA carboxylase biotin carboxyl carrier protein [Myxococcales bacterium]